MTVVIKERNFLSDFYNLLSDEDKELLAHDLTVFGACAIEAVLNEKNEIVKFKHKDITTVEEDKK
jgi:hypothetical protein